VQRRIADSQKFLNFEAAPNVGQYLNTDQGAVTRVNTLGNNLDEEKFHKTEKGAVAGVV
jgi:hypothetical protein